MKKFKIAMAAASAIAVLSAFSSTSTPKVQTGYTLQTSAPCEEANIVPCSPSPTQNCTI